MNCRSRPLQFSNLFANFGSHYKLVATAHIYKCSLLLTLITWEQKIHDLQEIKNQTQLEGRRLLDCGDMHTFKPTMNEIKILKSYRIHQVIKIDTNTKICTWFINGYLQGLQTTIYLYIRVFFYPSSKIPMQKNSSTV